MGIDGDSERRGGSDHSRPHSISISADGEATLPLAQVVTGRGFLTGKSGSGKSNSMGVLIEGVLDRGIPVCILDPEGEYIGLTEQYPVLHVGAHSECDVPVNATDAARIADTVVEEHVPVVLDTSEFMDDEELEELVAGVARRLFDREKTLQHPVLLVLEECHEYLPLRERNDATDRLLQVAKRGRKRGLGICGISQRPASVSKDFLTQCDWHGWHRLTYPNDLDVVRDLLTADHAAIVEDLAVGEALIWADWLAECQQIHWPRKQTLDYGSVPSIETALGSTPTEIESGVVDSFRVDHGMAVTLPEAGRACVEHLLHVVGALDEYERYLLDYIYQSESSIDPKPAYELIGGTPTSNQVYEKLRTLRKANLVTKAGHGEYRYALPDRVQSHLRFHEDIEQRHITAIVERLEADFSGVADSPVAVGATEPGDALETYTVYAKGSAGGYTQLGKPVTAYLGVAIGETVGVTSPTGDDTSHLVIAASETCEGEWTYSAYDRHGAASLTLGTPVMAALDAEPGDRVAVTAATEQTAHIAVSERGG